MVESLRVFGHVGFFFRSRWRRTAPGTREEPDGEIQFDHGLPDRPSEKTFLHRGEEVESPDGRRKSPVRTRWQRGGSGRYAINGGSGRAVGPELVSATPRIEASSIPCGSDEGPAFQCEG